MFRYGCLSNPGITWAVAGVIGAYLVLHPRARVFGLLFGLVFVFAGVVAWNYFSAVLQRAGNSLITDARLITKVYFPRLAIPLASTLSALIDLGVSLVVLAAFMAWYHIAPTWRILTLPLWIGITAICATGFSLWLSALNVKYRDVRYVVPFVVQLWLFVTP